MEDITITPFKTIELSQRVYHFSSRNDKFYATCSRNGIVTLLDADFNIMRVLDCSDTIKEDGDGIQIFTLHPFTDVFCIGSSDEYRIYDYSGMLFCAMQEKTEAVHYCPEKNLAWIVKRVDSETKKVCLVIDDLQRDCLRIEDKLYQSAVEFRTLPESDKVCMILMAGQDGMMTYILANENGKIICEQVERLDDDALLDFSEDNTKFLSVDPYGLDKISVFSYPSLEISGKFLLPEKYKENECLFGFNNLFLDSRYAINEIGENLYYILDTQKMQLLGRFVVKGHEPKPIVEYWPRLKDDEGQTTNLSCIYKTRNYLISPFKATPTDAEDNSLVIIKIQDIKDKIREMI